MSSGSIFATQQALKKGIIYKNPHIMLNRLMKAHRTTRYRIHPQTRAKARKLWATAGACRYVWNHFVGVLRDEYVFYGQCDPRAYSLYKRFTNLRKTDPWLNEYSCTIVRAPLKAIEINYRKFYKKQGGLPKFKRRYTSPASIPLTTGTFKLNGEWLHVQKIGRVRLVGHNPYPYARAVYGTIKNGHGDWYAYLVYEMEQEAALPHIPTEVGIDRNVAQVALADGTIYRSPNVEKLEARKRRYQRMMAGRNCGSRQEKRKASGRYLRARRRAQKTAAKITQARTNWCHQVSREISKHYDVVYLEDLNTKGMTASAKGTMDSPGMNVRQKSSLNRGILATGWYKPEQCLSYKATVVKVSPAYTSRTCHACGHVDAANRKSQSVFECVKCTHRDNADINAALNILAFGNGAAGRGGGGVSRPVKRQMDTEVFVDFKYIIPLKKRMM